MSDGRFEYKFGSALAATGVLTFVALYRYKIDVLWVVLAGGLIGLIRMVFV